MKTNINQVIGDNYKIMQAETKRLRAQLTELKNSCQLWNDSNNDSVDEIVGLRQQLALNELEIGKLRKALECVYQCDYALDKKGRQILVDDHPCLLVTLEEERIIYNALSTTFTTDHLTDWCTRKISRN